MFSGRFDTKPREDGSYFIDRDGTHFRYILNYLRTGQLIVPEDEIVRREILVEAKFYRIEGIINELTPKLFKESEILSPNQKQTLINWLKETQNFTNTSLLYRASRDGWAASNFHSCCDNKGPTVTVVKSGNYICGGYAEKHWESGRSYLSALCELPCSMRSTENIIKQESFFAIKVNGAFVYLWVTDKAYITIKGGAGGGGGGRGIKTFKSD